MQHSAQNIWNIYNVTNHTYLIRVSYQVSTDVFQKKHSLRFIKLVCRQTSVGHTGAHRTSLLQSQVSPHYCHEHRFGSRNMERGESTKKTTKNKLTFTNMFYIPATKTDAFQRSQIGDLLRQWKQTLFFNFQINHCINKFLLSIQPIKIKGLSNQNHTVLCSPSLNCKNNKENATHQDFDSLPLQPSFSNSY